MQTQSLVGPWKLSEANKRATIPATVPGCVHIDLMAAGKLDDPYYRDREPDAFWIGETDWTYRRSFSVSKTLLKHDRVILHCDGLDTLATVHINGKKIASTDNMFRTYEWDIKKVLKAGRNTIDVTFASAMDYVQKRNEKRSLPAWGVGDHKLDGGGWIRKEPCNFGWDWGPRLVTCGIWRDIKLIAFNTARIDDVHILQDHSPTYTIGLDVNIEVGRIHKAKCTAVVRISQNGKSISEAAHAFATKSAKLHFDIENPKYWWPGGMGDQPLYDIDIELRDISGNLLDTAHKRIGLRTLTLDTHDDQSPRASSSFSWRKK